MHGDYWVTSDIGNRYKIPMRCNPWQYYPPKNPNVSEEAHDVLDKEAKGLLDKGAVSKVTSTPGEFVSSFFAVPKPRSEKWRPIINLKNFNSYVRHYKFRMETFQKIREWIQPGSYLVGLDLKDQFLSVPVNSRFWKFLRFQWLGELLEWMVLPFGLKCSPRVVTKILRPIMGFLRRTWGILI